MTRGKRRPEAKYVAINFEVPEDVRDVFQISCMYRRTSQAEVLRAAVDKFIEDSKEIVETRGGKCPKQLELW